MSRATQLVPFALKRIVLDLRPTELRRNRLVSRHLSPSDGSTARRFPIAGSLHQFRRRGERTSGIWAITVVRNEADIIRYTVEHLLAEGVDRVVIADNLSDDSTSAILAELASRLPVTVLDDSLDAHYQGAKMTRLARWAWSQGAEWIVPFDADELWYSLTGSLRDTFAEASANVVMAEMWGHLPQPTDDAHEHNPYVRIRTRAVSKLPAMKVAFRAHRWARVFDGNHSVHRPGNRETLLSIRHLPLRSREQMIRKLRDGGRALDSTDLPKGVGHHWRRLSVLSDEDILREISSSATGLTHPDPLDDRVDDPAPFRSDPRGTTP